MGTFKRAQKFSKTSKDLDQKIQSLNEEMVKTGMSASKKMSICLLKLLIGGRSLVKHRK